MLGAPPRSSPNAVPMPASRLVLLSVFSCVLMTPLATCQNAAPAATEVDGVIARGDSAMNRLAYGEAARIYGEAVALDPESAQAHSRQGLALWASQQFEKAVPVLDRAIELDPEDAYAYYYRGSSHLALDNFEQSVADLAEATRLGSLPVEDAMRAHHIRSIGYMNLEEYDAAIDAVSEAIATKPDHPFYYLERARLYDFTGQADAAVEDYNAFLRLDQGENQLSQEAEQRIAILRGEAPPQPAAPDSTGN